MRPILVVDDDLAVRSALCQTLDLAGFEARGAGSFVEAKDHIGPDFTGVIVSDIRMPGRDGFYLLDYTRGLDPDLPVILLTGEGDIPMAVRAMREGAFGFLEKPCPAADLVALVGRGMKAREVVMENRALRAQLAAGDPAARMIFGISRQAEALRDQARRAGRGGSDALIVGALGSGIAKVAEVVHLCSPRAGGAFEKRAAAGLGREALMDLWQVCKGGTLFIDEITQLSDDAQLALLDLLERGGLVVIGGSTCDPEQVEGLSADLFYRLDVARLHIPALAQRPEDIPVLYQRYVMQAAEQAGVSPPEIPAGHLASLMARDWPGNARGVMSAAMRFVLGMPDDTVQEDGLGLAEQMAQVERALLVAALERHEGRASEAAQALKLPRKTFYDKLARYGIRPDQYRPESPI